MCPQPTAPTAPLAGPDPFVGRVLGGRYRLEELIGKGGFGAVYRATQAPVDRAVAVKIIRRAPDDEGMRQRFFREARVLARLTDPGTVTLHDYGEEPDGLLYMVQAFIEGRSLSQVLAGGRTLEPVRAGHITARVLHALEEAHRLGVVHRDIKPANVMLGADHDGRDVVRVLDFGVAKVVAADEPDDFETVTGVALGTPTYMAPERATEHATGPAIDQYAVGVLLFRMLAGRVPYRGRTHYETLRMHVERAVPPLPDVDPRLEAVVHRALAKDPAQRFADVGAMRGALLSVLDALEGRARRVESAGPVGSPIDVTPPAVTPSISEQPTAFVAPPAAAPAVARWVIPALAMLALVLATAVYVVLRTSAPAPPVAEERVVIGAAPPALPAAAPVGDADAALDAAPDTAAQASPDVGSDAAPDASPPDAAPPAASSRPPRRRARRPSRAAPPAAPEPPKPAPAKPDARALAERVDRALAECRCEAADAAFRALTAAAPAAADARKAALTRQCRLIGVGCNR